MITHRYICRVMVFASVVVGTLGGHQALAERNPNIIVFYTDDHGHADLSCQGVVPDVKTPHVDALAATGVRAVHGYSTAPQCVPSRGGLMTGKFQARFGLETNGSSLDGFNKEITFARRLQQAGYVTAQFGKWHLGPTSEIIRHGFTHVFAQNANRPFTANISLDGKDRPLGDLDNEMYHIEGCSRAAAALIERYRDKPFFLYIAYRAPHVPLDAPQKYLDRFPGAMPERRRQALAMLSAVDDGVGLITGTLQKLNLTSQTILFYIGDNGAPLKIDKADEPGGGAGWDGSLNDPLNGEKGMLAEGGMHVPYVVAWPGVIPGGQTYPHPISTLDVAATAVALGGVAVNPGELDGVNLIPHLRGDIKTPPHEALFWRWEAQAAIREGPWKLLRGGDREYLYNLDDDLSEKKNLLRQYPEMAGRLRERLRKWSNELNPPGLTIGAMAKTWTEYFDFYLEGKPSRPSRDKRGATEPNADKEDTKASPSEGGIPEGHARSWTVRNGSTQILDGALRITADKAHGAFLTRAGIEVTCPANVHVTLRVSEPGAVAVAWRGEGQKEFNPDLKRSGPVTPSEEWQHIQVQIPAPGKIVHMRLMLPGGTTQIQRIELSGGQSDEHKVWTFGED